jgi:hypothetical protein
LLHLPNQLRLFGPLRHSHTPLVYENEVKKQFLQT